MSVLHDFSFRRHVGSVTIQRQPIVHPDRSVYGYAVRAQVIGAGGTPRPTTASSTSSTPSWGSWTWRPSRATGRSCCA
ncbi:hypothetical protein [Cellulomonas soli]